MINKLLLLQHYYKKHKIKKKIVYFLFLLYQNLYTIIFKKNITV